MNMLWIKETRDHIFGILNGHRRRNGIRVFCYHGLIEREMDPVLERNFCSLSNFQDHIHFLRRFRILSLAELADELSTPTDQREPAAVITFDDGYANNLLAAEILGAFRLPWSIFITTGVLRRENPIWALEISLLLLHGESEQISVLDKVWRLKSRREREEAFHGIRHPLKAMPSVLRRPILNYIREQFPAGETQRLLNKFPSLQMLSWEEVSQLASAGVEVGSHGVNHEIHRDNLPEEIRRHELTESKAKLEKQLGRSCEFFAFPNGDFTLSSAGEVRAAGYKLAFTTQAGTILPGANPYMLPRLTPYGSLPAFERNFFWEPPAGDG